MSLSLTPHPLSFTAERKAALRAELESEIAGAANPEEIEGLRSAFNARERSIETSVDSKVRPTVFTNRNSNTTDPRPPLLARSCQIHNFSATLDVEYNFLAK